MRQSQLNMRRLWIAAGLAVAMLATAIVIVSLNEKAQGLGRWLPRVTIDRKARKITLGIGIDLATDPAKPR